MGRTNWFSKPEPRILEVEKFRTIPNGPDAVEAIAALSDAPGMQYLLAKLDIAKAGLVTQLRDEKHQDLREVQYLQAGIFWASWLQRQLTHNLKLQANSSRPLTPAEDESYKALESTLELIGAPQG